MSNLNGFYLSPQALMDLNTKPTPKPPAAEQFTAPYLRIADAARYCACSPEYLSKCVRKRELVSIKKGRCVWFAVADLDTWMRRDRTAAA